MPCIIIFQPISVSPFSQSTAPVSLVYSISDGRSGSATAQLNITVLIDNHAPVAVNDSGLTQQNKPVILSLLDNDSDVDGDQLKIFEVFNISGGSAEISTDQSTVLVTPTTDSSDSVNFSYTVTDGNGDSDWASVSVATIEVLSQWIDPVFSIEMLRISSGSFSMGSATTETDRDADEGPQHNVSISNDFYIGKYEITQSQWQNVMGTDASWPALNLTTENGLSPAHPAYNISYTDITRVGGFLDKINEASACDISSLSTGAARYLPADVPAGCYRLPTESEWEYAARAGTTYRFSFGNDETYSKIWYYGWYSDNSFALGSSHPDYGTHIAGQKLPNPWGLYDVHGNVMELVYDWYEAYDNLAVIDPSGASEGISRIARGGGWQSQRQYCRSADRAILATDSRNSYTGLRLLKTPRGQEDQSPELSTSLIAEPLAGGVALNWAEVNGANAYKIFYSPRSPVSSFDAYQISTNNQLIFTDFSENHHERFYFRVQAYNDHGASPLSA